ncbi:hypothetical protein P4200_22630 [Pseudomonas aeruginosa]|nr:hypothetical protein [Pseudomonas aeruginosa]
MTVATRSAAGGSAGDAAEGCWSRDLALFWYAPISTPRWRKVAVQRALGVCSFSPIPR